MEDFTTSVNNHSGRMSTSARGFNHRRSNPGSPRKSVSIDSLAQYNNSNDSSAASSRQSSANYSRQHPSDSSMPLADTPIPSSTIMPSSMSNGYSNHQEYNHHQPRSNPGSPSKRVLFKGVTNNPVSSYDHGKSMAVAPYHGNGGGMYDNNHLHHMHTPQLPLSHDEVLAIETTNPEPKSYAPMLMSNGYHPSTTTISNHNTALVPSSRAMIVPPVSGSTKALVTPNNHILNGHALPPLDYHNPSSQSIVPATTGGTGNKYIVNNMGIPPSIVSAVTQSLKPTTGNSNALPAIMPSHNGALEPYEAKEVVPSTSASGASGSSSKQLATSNGSEKEGTKDAKNKDLSSKNGKEVSNSSSTSSNNGVVKVAMFGEISMANFHQCKQ